MWAALSSALVWLVVALCTGTAWLAIQVAGSAASSAFNGAGASLFSALALSVSCLFAIFYLWRTSPRRHIKEEVHSPITEKAAEMLAAESRKLNLSPPNLVVTRSAGIRDARVYFIGRRSAVILPETFSWLAFIRPDELKAILSHELSHIANGDAWRGAVAHAAVVFATVVVVVSSAIVTAAHAYQMTQIAANYTLLGALRPRNLLGYIQSLVMPVACLAILLAAYTTFLRLREYVADVTAATAGHRQAMRQILSRAAATAGLRQRTLSFHPSAGSRLSRLKPLNFDRGPGPGAIFTATAALMATDSLFTGLQPDSQSNVLSMIQAGTHAALTFLLFALLGIALGRSPTFRGVRHRPSLALRQSALAVGGVLLGAFVVQLCLELPRFVRVGAPIEVDLLRAAQATLMQSLIPVTTLLCSMALGALSQRGNPSERRPEAALVVVAMAISYAASGATLAALLWLIRNQMDLSQASAFFAFDDLVGLRSVAMVAVAAGGGLALAGLVFTGRAFRYFRLRNTRRRRQIAVLLGIALAVHGGNSLASLSWVVIATHLSERETLWVRCVVPPGATGGSTADVQRFVDTLATKLDSTLSGVSTQRGKARARIQQPVGCSAQQQGHADARSMVRQALDAVGQIQDSSLELSLVNAREIIARYEGASGRTWERRLTVDTINVEGLIGELMAVHDPHRWAMALTDRDWKNLGVAQRLLMDLREQGSDHERSWASLQLANLSFERGAFENAEAHLRHAHSIAPDSEVVQRRLAHVLLRQSKCDDAAHFMPMLLHSQHLDVEYLTLWSWCEAVRGTPRDRLATLWMYRVRFSDSANLMANIGLSAQLVGSRDLATEYFQHAEKLDPGNRDWCVPLYLACLMTTRCPTPAPHEPPMPLNSAEQNVCWGRILRGHVAPESVAHYWRKAIELRPDLARTGLGKELEDLLSGK